MISEIEYKLDEKLCFYCAKVGVYPNVIVVSYETYIQMLTLLQLYEDGKEYYKGIEVKLDRPYERNEMRFDFVKEEIK